MTDIQIVPMNESHLEQVLAIERTAFTTPWSEEMFRQEVRGAFGSRAVVAVSGGRVIGYQIAWFIPDEVHLVNIAVREDCRSRGVGSLMLNHLIDDAMRAGKIILTLEVRASNAGAQAFYRRFFFRTIGVRKGYYSDNREDALLMVLDLKSLSQRRGVGAGESRAG